MSAATDARRDLIRKLELEKKLARDVAKLNRNIVNRTILSFATSGISFDASILQDDFAAVLEKHYKTASNIFAEQMTETLPVEIAITEDESTTIQKALAAYFVARALEQADIITKTNQKNIDDSVAAARQTFDDNGKPLSQLDQARTAGALTARKLRGRLRSIATTETQNAAETSKATEAEVLSGRQPSIITSTPSDAGVEKEWVTVGDEKVRIDHVKADSQMRDLSKPFTVGGQLLRWPGDTALGATVENVINCRCSSVYDANAVFAIRRRKAQEAFTETVPSEQLLESLG